MNHNLLNHIEQALKLVQKDIDKFLLHEIGTPKMSALTSCKHFLIKAGKYARSYEKHCINVTTKSKWTKTERYLKGLVLLYVWGKQNVNKKFSKQNKKFVQTK